MIVAINANTCRCYLYAAILAVSCLFAGPAVHAKVFSVVVHSQFRNDNWFSLSARGMESAAVDTALSGLSSNMGYQFIFRVFENIGCTTSKRRNDTFKELGELDDSSGSDNFLGV